MSKKKTRKKPKSKAKPVAVNAAPAEGVCEEVPASADATVPVAREDYEALQSEKESLQDQMMRVAAEFENYRKRIAKEKSLWEIMVTKKALNDVLSILNSVNRGLQVHDAGSCAGLEAIRDQINSILDRTGVRPIEADGKPFDPDYHEALFTEETETVAPNTVMAEIEAGYTYQGTVLIPSKVKVSRAPAKADDSGETEVRSQKSDDSGGADDE